MFVKVLSNNQFHNCNTNKCEQSISNTTLYLTDQQELFIRDIYILKDKY